MTEDDEEMPGLPQYDNNAPPTDYYDDDENLMDESGTDASESSHSHGINGVGRAT